MFTIRRVVNWRMDGPDLRNLFLHGHHEISSSVDRIAEIVLREHSGLENEARYYLYELPDFIGGAVRVEQSKITDLVIKMRLMNKGHEKKIVSLLEKQLKS